MSATCGAGPAGIGCRAGGVGAGVGAGGGAGGAAGSRRGVTTVVGASPGWVAAGEVVGGVVVAGGGSAENAGGAATRAARRIAVKRAKVEGKSGSGSPAAEGRPPALPGGLYVVATPIGNLGDVTARARETLAACDVVAAEDTRVAKALLTHLGIRARVVAVHAHNERAAAEGVLALLREGRSVALTTDAGTPAVSDPGALVVDRVRAEGHPVIPVPGPSALTAALSASGIVADGVVFAGFLPARGAERKRRLAELAAGPWAIALFESPHRIEATLADLHAALGERDVVVCRELTKRFETIARVPLAGAVAWVRADPDRSRGEFVLVVEGRPVEAAATVDPRRVLEALLAELPVKQAVALAVRITGAARNELYAMALAMKPGRQKG